MAVSTAFAKADSEDGSVVWASRSQAMICGLPSIVSLAERRDALGWIGVHLQPATDDMIAATGAPATRVAIITYVDQDSPAAQAGLEVGDIVLRFRVAPDSSRRNSSLIEP